MNKLLVLIGMIIFIQGFASDNNSSSFSNLQLEKNLSSMQLDIAKNKLEQLKVQAAIDNLSGIKKSDQSIKISVLEINIFNNNKQAVISVAGITNTYKQGDVLTGDLILNKINSKSIDVLNTQTQQHREYVIK